MSRPSIAPTTARNTRTGGASAPQSWIVSAGFDALFLVNAWWLLALLPGFLSSDRTPHIEFWQIYFLTTPHRWITLFLVAADPDRRAGRSWLFVAIAVAAIAVIGGVWLAGGGFTCLLLIDYVWNAWHFAAQHAGVLRMYSRKAGGGRPRLETWGLRSLVFYVSIRLAGWSTGWTESVPAAQTGLTILDGIMTLPAVALVVSELTNHPRARLGKVLYSWSVTGLYMCLLVAVSQGYTTAVLSLTGAAAAFHAVEYLAIVSHYADRRKTQGTPGAFRRMATAWGTILGAYLVLFGLFANLADLWAHQFWLGINLWAAALHYAYDGLIWKLRSPQTAAALGVELGGSYARRQLPERIQQMPESLEPLAAGSENG